MNGQDTAGRPMEWSGDCEAWLADGRVLRGTLSPTTMAGETVQVWAGGAAVRDKHKRLPGIRVVGGLDDTLGALRDWRAEHP